MAFVPVPRGSDKIWMAVTETRQRDLAQMGAKRRSSESAACGVTWHEAKAFCHALTQRERATGKIRQTERYRLPTDHEWSCAVGLGEAESPDVLPEEKSNKVQGFPWGTHWPPHRGSGNFMGEEASTPPNVIQGYRDPVERGPGKAGLSKPNALGLRDLAGNLWEWCEDLYRPGTNWRVLRGGAWTSWRPETLASSHRTHDPETYRSDSVGFRCVLVEE
jgi:formylglycine-generating enzyme required for sulfatase activity